MVFVYTHSSPLDSMALKTELNENMDRINGRSETDLLILKQENFLFLSFRLNKQFKIIRKKYLTRSVKLAPSILGRK